MTIISPSLLACDFLNIESELKVLEKEDNLWLHLDIMDGHFVPNLTFGHPIIKQISNKTNNKLDAHLMVSNPEFYIESFKKNNIHNITFHYEATDSPLELINNLKKIYPSVGISIKPNTDVKVLSNQILKNLDLILVMSVEPGFGGQKFMTNSIEKIETLNKLRKKHNYRFQIQVDGGVNDLNSNILVSAGADNLVAGSYIFKNNIEEYHSKIESLRN